MIKAIFSLSCLFLPVWASGSPDDVVIVINRANPVESMTRIQLIDLFMGKIVAFPDGRKAIPIDLEGSNQIKEIFYKKLVRMSLAKVNSYWSRMMFTGKVRPPLTRQDEESVIAFIAENESAIGYISREKVTKKMKIIFSFNE